MVLIIGFPLLFSSLFTFFFDNLFLSFSFPAEKSYWYSPCEGNVGII